MNRTGASACYLCPEGYSCTNRDVADPCKQGYYCPEGTGADLQPCPTGTFGNTTGLGKVTQCTECTGKIVLGFFSFKTFYLYCNFIFRQLDM